MTGRLMNKDITHSDTGNMFFVSTSVNFIELAHSGTSYKGFVVFTVTNTSNESRSVYVKPISNEKITPQWFTTSLTKSRVTLKKQETVRIRIAISIPEDVSFTELKIWLSVSEQRKSNPQNDNFIHVQLSQEKKYDENKENQFPLWLVMLICLIVVIMGSFIIYELL